MEKFIKYGCCLVFMAFMLSGCNIHVDNLVRNVAEVSEADTDVIDMDVAEISETDADVTGMSAEEISEMQIVNAAVLDICTEMRYFDALDERLEYVKGRLDTLEEEKRIKNILLNDDKTIYSFLYYTSDIPGGIEVVDFSESVDSNGHIKEIDDPRLFVN